MLVALASHSRQDEQVIDPSATGSVWQRFIDIVDDLLVSDEMKNDFSVEESILNHVLRLLKKEMPDNVKMLAQYFQFFVNYSSMGRHEVCREENHSNDLKEELSLRSFSLVWTIDTFECSDTICQSSQWWQYIVVVFDLTALRWTSEAVRHSLDIDSLLRCLCILSIETSKSSNDGKRISTFDGLCLVGDEGLAQSMLHTWEWSDLSYARINGWDDL